VKDDEPRAISKQLFEHVYSPARTDFNEASE
jgi:hypothetical protein